MNKYYPYDEVKCLSQLISLINKAINKKKMTTNIEASQIAKQVIESQIKIHRYRNISQEQLINLIAKEKPFLEFKTELGLFLKAFKEDAMVIRSRQIDPTFSIKNYSTLQLWLPKLIVKENI